MKKYILWILLAVCFLFTGCNAKTPAETETKTLTLATFRGESSHLLQWVELYNENHSDVKIETVNYLETYPDLYEALNQIKIEISAGKGPDMIDFGWQYSPLDASCGMLADLYPFMQNDESFDQQDFYFNILEAFEVGGSLYVLVPSYTIDSYATANKDLAGLERMDIHQLVDAYNMLDEESILFPGETKSAVFGMICLGSLENYIDWGAGTCDFDSDSFKELLNFSNQFPLNLNITNDYSPMAVFAEGHALLYPVSIDNVYAATSVRMLLGETPTYIGYPFDSGCGSMAEIANLAIGISASSQNKEEAWGFLKSLLGSEYQDSIKRGLPVRVSSLEQKLEAAMRTEYNANGEKVVKESMRFEGEEPVNIYEISAEDAETLKSIISKIEYNSEGDHNLSSILQEEAGYLFNDGRNVDDVAKIIQNRASVYISENK
ncbi:MAG: extracellular solute-binding protein [Acetatifactor sp.]|nr:extracellular solute-binding protein [Acetatifactor sp.]